MTSLQKIAILKKKIINRNFVTVTLWLDLSYIDFYELAYPDDSHMTPRCKTQITMFEHKQTILCSHVCTAFYLFEKYKGTTHMCADTEQIYILLIFMRYLKYGIL